MAGNLHGYHLRNSASNHISYRCSPQIVKQLPLESHLFTHLLPGCFRHTLQSLTSKMTDPGAGRIAQQRLLFPLPQGLLDVFDERNKSALVIFRRARLQPRGFLSASGAQHAEYALPFRRPNLAGTGETWYRHGMTQLAQKLDKKLASWRPEVAAHVEQIVTDVIELADTDTLDLQPSRAVVQEVLDALDERQAG